MTRDTTILVDAKNLLYRAHFAFADLATSEGKPTSVLHGFPSMLVDVLKAYPGANMVICWEGGIPLQGVAPVVEERRLPPWRKTLSPTYKANRKPNPEFEKAQQQLPHLVRGLASLRFLQVIGNGIEADDWFGLISTSLLAEDPERLVLMYSSDRDLYQLVRRGCSMLQPLKGGGVERLRSTDIVERTGVTPKKWVLYKALAGDTSDNIKALPGIGPKRALKLLEDGVDASIPTWAAVPELVKAGHPELQERWEALHTAYLLSLIPREPGYALWPAALQNEARHILSLVSRERVRKYPKAVLDSCKKEWLNYCAEWELTYLISERHTLLPSAEG